MDIFSNDYAIIVTFMDLSWLIWRYQSACKRHKALTLKDIALLSDLNYCYLCSVCDKHEGISLDRFKTIYEVLYNDLLKNGELNNA